MSAITHPAFPVQFWINHGGIGDFIYMVTAIEYAIQNFKHITHGSVIAPHFFYDYAKHWLKNYDKFPVLKNPECLPDIPLLEPKLHGYQPNAAGFHLLEIGFQQFCNMPVPDGWWKMPEINGDEADISRFKLPEKYVVITTEATAENRLLPGESVNELADHVRAAGFLPVFLGKNKITGGYSSTSPKGCEFKGYDLRNKTYPMEAAVILAKASCVIGLDNGLLHLAACSMVPVVAAFSNVRPGDRRFLRREGAKTYYIAPPKDTCRFCHSTERYTSQSANYCYTDTFACVKSLTGQVLIKGFDHLTRGTHGLINDNASTDDNKEVGG